jgi:hypothetical protein
MHATTATVLFAALMTAALAAPAGANSHGGSLPIRLDQGPRLTLSEVTATRTNGELLVSGRVEKRFDQRGRILGHVDLDLVDASGNLVARHVGALSYFSPARHNPDYAEFEAVIEGVPDNVAAIRVRHTVGSP